MSRYPQASDYTGNNNSQPPAVPQYEQNGMGHPPPQHHHNPYQGQPPAHGGGGYQQQQQQYYQGGGQQPHVVVIQQGGGGGHHHHQQPQPHHHQQPQHHHHHQQQQYYGNDGGFYGSNPDAKEPMQFNRKESVDAMIVQGEPIYSEDDCNANPELRKFRTNGYQDVWAAVLFAISFLGTIVVAIVNAANDKISFEADPSSVHEVNGEPIVVGLVKGAGIGVAFSLVFCIIMLFAMRAAPYGFIVVCNILAVCLMLGIAILGFIVGDTTLAVIGILLTLLIAAWLWCVRHMIPFSALMLESSTHVTLNNFGCVGYAFGTLVVSAGYYVAWICMVAPTIDDFNQGNNTSAAAGVSIIFVLMVYWTFQVMHNIAHVTSGGVMATWYFMGGDSQMPSTASSSSFVRAITTSLGSICFGSLIVAIIQTIEFIVRSSMRDSRNGIMQCIALCILSCIESLMQYFNRLAYSFIAIFGIGYIDAAKMTWDYVVRGSVWSTLINDILLERVFILVNLAQTAISAVIVWFIWENWVALIGAIFMSLGTGLIIFNVVDSGSVTLMVASATCPEVFPQKHPELSRRIEDAIRQMERGGCCSGGDDE